MTASPTSGDDPIKVGLIADQTGPLSIMGLAHANVARMVVGDLNAKGGLLGRPLELHREDGAPWLMRETGARTFYLPSADYIWPHVLNRRVRDVVTANGGEIVGEDYFPLDHEDYRATVGRIAATGADFVFNTTVPLGVMAFLEQLHESGFTSRGGKLVCTYFEENLLGVLPAAQVEGMYSCLDYYQTVGDPFSRRLLAQYDALYPGAPKFTGGSGCSGLYRGLRLWASAVTEAGSLDQGDVIAALDHARIAEGPGGPAAMVPGQHHVRMHMYIGQARGGRFELVETLGVIDPQERLVAPPALAV